MRFMKRARTNEDEASATYDRHHLEHNYFKAESILDDCQEERHLAEPLKQEPIEHVEIKEEPMWFVEPSDIKSEVPSDMDNVDLGGRPQRRAETETLPTSVLRLVRCDDPHWSEADADTNHSQVWAQLSQSSVPEVINLLTIPSVKLEQQDDAQLKFGFVDVGMDSDQALPLEWDQATDVDPLKIHSLQTTSLESWPGHLHIKLEPPDELKQESFEVTCSTLKSLIPLSSGSKLSSKQPTSEYHGNEGNHETNSVDNNKTYINSTVVNAVKMCEPEENSATTKNLHSPLQISHRNTSRVSSRNKCNNCGAKLVSSSRLVEEHKCSFPDLAGHKEQRSEDEPSHEEIKYKCGKCGASFSRKCSLNMHIRSHSGMEHYSCHMCDCDSHESPLEKEFVSESPSRSPIHLDKHSRIQSKENFYTCGECKVRFTKKSRLKAHIRQHSIDKPFVCGECNTRFSDKGRLKAHIKMHSIDKLFVCLECNARFTNKHRLIRHNRVHSGERPYVCTVCKSSFTQKSHLMVHERIHLGEEKPYLCDVCNLRFSQNSHLTVHKRIHSGVRPFACGQCKERFMRNRDLITHKRKHFQKKPIKR